MQGLSRYALFVKVCLVCQGMQGFSKYGGFVKIERVCQGMLGLSKHASEGLEKVFHFPSLHFHPDHLCHDAFRPKAKNIPRGNPPPLA